MNAAVITTWVWLILEIGLRVRDRMRGTGSRALDRGTRLTIFLLMVPAIVVGGLLAGTLADDSPWRFPGPALFWVIAGTVVMWLGLVLRVWAIVVLGKSFRTTVEVHADQAVVDRGPYHWVRHPSYSGILLITAGYGLAADNWISLLILAAVPAFALMRRITVEETVLVEAMGRPYEEYRATTKRLVPGVW